MAGYCEQHPNTTNQICAHLDVMDIICDHRTLSQDIAQRNEQGYYVENRSFPIPEPKIFGGYFDLDETGSKIHYGCFIATDLQTFFQAVRTRLL